METPYFRLVYCLTETCTKTARSLVLFYHKSEKPSGYQDDDWTLDEFLYQHRTDQLLRNLHPKQEIILFPGHKKDTDLQQWDISLLFIVLELFKKDPVTSKDIFFIKKMRNNIFHAPSTSITDEKYTECKNKIMVFAENCSKILEDTGIIEEISDIFKDTDDVLLTEESKEQIKSDLENWYKSDPFFKCIDTLPSDIGSLMEELFRKLKEALNDVKFEIPDILVGVRVTNCSSEISQAVSEQILHYMCGEGSRTDKESRLWKAISVAKEALLAKHRILEEIRRGCLILCIRCVSFEAVWYLLSDCITGRMTSLWNDVQLILREQHSAPKLEMDLGMTSLEVLRCIEQLANGISAALQPQSIPANSDVQSVSVNLYSVDCSTQTEVENGSVDAKVVPFYSTKNEFDDCEVIHIVARIENTKHTLQDFNHCDSCFIRNKKFVYSTYMCRECRCQLCNNCLNDHMISSQTRLHTTISLERSDSRDTFCQEKLLHTLTSKLSRKDETDSLLSSKLHNVQSDIVNTIRKKRQTRRSYKSAMLKLNLNVSRMNDKKICDIRGVVLVRDKLIICDAANDKLKVFDSTRTFLYEKMCDKKPNDISSVDNCTVAVSFWGCIIRLYSVGSNSMKETVKINTMSKCLGLCCFEKTIYVVVYDRTGCEWISRILAYTLDGYLIRSFEYSSCNVLTYITVNPRTGILYVTDFYKGVIVLSKNGHLIAVFSHQLMKNPQGISIDEQGNIYVCGVNSHNVIQMSADGNTVVEFLSRNVRCRYSQCVKIYENIMFLTRRESDVISMYELSYSQKPFFKLKPLPAIQTNWSQINETSY